MQALNPELVRGVTPPEFVLRVPKGTGDKLKTEIAGIPADKLTSWRLATFSTGETLGEVARQYHVTLASLENVNVIDAHEPPADGTVLMVPAAPPRVRLIYYRVHRADTLESIASQYSVSVSELQRWNRLRTSKAPAGRTLRIYENSYPGETVTASRTVTAAARPSTEHAQAATETAAPHQTVKHEVRSGETLWSIAREYGTTVEALKQANPFLASRELEVGDRLNVTPRKN